MENWGSEWQECEGWDGNAGNQRGYVGESAWKYEKCEESV